MKILYIFRKEFEYFLVFIIISLIINYNYFFHLIRIIIFFKYFITQKVTLSTNKNTFYFNMIYLFIKNIFQSNLFRLYQLIHNFSDLFCK